MFPDEPLAYIIVPDDAIVEDTTIFAFENPILGMEPVIHIELALSAVAPRLVGIISVKSDWVESAVLFSFIVFYFFLLLLLAAFVNGV